MFIKEIARRLRTSRSSVKRWIYRGQLKTHRTPAGYHYITEEDLEAYLKKLNPDL